MESVISMSQTSPRFLGVQPNNVTIYKERTTKYVHVLFFFMKCIFLLFINNNCCSSEKCTRLLLTCTYSFFSLLFPRKCSQTSPYSQEFPYKIANKTTSTPTFIRDTDTSAISIYFLKQVWLACNPCRLQVSHTLLLIYTLNFGQLQRRATVCSAEPPLSLQPLCRWPWHVPRGKRRWPHRRIRRHWRGKLAVAA